MSRLRKFARIVLWVGIVGFLVPLRAQDLSPWIQFGGHEAHPSRILARLKPTYPAATPEVQSLVQELGLTFERQYSFVSGLVALDVPQSSRGRAAVVSFPDKEQQKQLLIDRIAALRGSGFFLYAEPDYVKRPLLDPTDAKYADGTLWGLHNIGDNKGVVGVDIGAPAAWNLTTGSRDVVVAVIDTGVRYTHWDLAAQMWVNPGEIPGNGVDDDQNGVVDDIHGFDAINRTGDPMDGDDHGTHVSGTIGAAANDGNPHVGVAWNVQIMACRFLGALGGTTADGIDCIGYAMTNGARIMNNSWGGGPYEQALYDAIAATRDAGMLFVAAAGNEGTDNDYIPSYPCNYAVDNVISVAAIDRADQLADWGFGDGSGSNFGRSTVHLGAPGKEIYSCVSSSDTYYDIFQGTSMAAPHVSGVAALVCSLYPGVSLTELRERLLQTVVPTPALAQTTITGGRVNAYKALSAVGDGDLEVSITPPNNATLLAGSATDFFVQVTDMFGVRNATVLGTYGAGQVLSFANDGNAPDVTAGDDVYSGQMTVPNQPGELLLRLVVTAPGKNPSTNEFRYYVIAPPNNDDFVDAAKIPTPGDLILAVNDYATIEPGEPVHADVPTVSATLWWNWSAENDGPVLVDTAGSSFNTVVAVYTGSPVNRLQKVAAADNAGGRAQGFVTFTAKAGTTYRVVVGGSDASQTGTIRLRLMPNGVPDTVPPVIKIDSPSNGLETASNRITVRGTADDSKTGGSGVAEVLVRLVGDLTGRTANGTTNWSASFTLQEGANVILAGAVDYARLQSPQVSVTVTYKPELVANDHFIYATQLTGDSGSVAANNVGATKEFLEPNHANNDGGHSIWYRWTAPANGVLQLVTTNAQYDTLLAVYTGSVVTNLTLVAANDDVTPGSGYSKVSCGVLAGTVYHIAVDGYSASSGSARLAYEFTSKGLFRLSITWGEGGYVKPTSGDFEADSTVVVTATPLPGYRFTGWTGSINSPANPLSVLMDQDQVLAAHFAAESFTDDFESGGFSPALAYQFTPPGSSARWVVQTNSAETGRYAARSGAILDNQRSSLMLSANMAADVASFGVRVSSELIFDKLEFYLNGVRMTNLLGMANGFWSGEVPWTTVGLVVPAGTNTFEWRYSKDSALAEGEDAAYIDNIRLPLNSQTPGGVRLLVVASGSQTSLEIQGESGQTYIIEVSSDLQKWTTVGTSTAVGGVIRFVDDRPAGETARFYRAYRP